MVVESLAIISIVLAVAFVFLRARKTAYAYGILPLLLVPVMKLATPVILPLLSFLKADTVNLQIGILLVALLAACIQFGIISAQFKSRRAKIGYVVLCGLFTMILGMLFILDVLKV